ncbi:MAG: hypothetical protein ACLFU6_07655, partial [Candidatus Hydrogenedentota bacterium]
MTYRLRFTVAAAGSALVHLLLIALMDALPEPPSPEPTPPPEPIVFELPPEEEAEEAPGELARRLIDAMGPPEEPVEDTDLIAEQMSRAADPFDVMGDEPRPFFEDPAEFDELGAPPTDPA